MAIKDITGTENIKINVILRDGTQFIGKDITPKPMGEHDRVISFWDERKLKAYPLDLVEYFEYTFDKS